MGAIKRKISGKKGGRRKGSVKKSGKKGAVRKGARRGRPSSGLAAVARAAYDEKKSTVIAGMDAAFAKAVKADSLSGLEKLSSKMGEDFTS